VSAAFIAAFLAAASLGQQARVSRVRVTGVPEREAREVHRHIRMRSGDLFSEKALQKDYLAVLALPFVESAAVRKAETDEGVEIVYEIESRRLVEAVRFEGNRKFSDRKLRRIGNLEDVRYYNLVRLNEARRLILEEYNRKGYIFARVDFKSLGDGTVLFTIDEGRRTKVTKVEIVGNEKFSDRVLKKRIRTRTRRYLILPCRLDREVVENDVLSLRDFYREHGYLDASVKVELDVDEEKGARITVTYLIEEGPLYRVSDVEIYGNEVLSADSLFGKLEMTKGEPFSPSGLQRDVDALTQAYGVMGYIDAAVKPVTTIDEARPLVKVSYRIEEGAPVYVNEIAIIGNDKTRDNVIRRELEFAPTELFSTVAMERSKKNLDRLGYFSSTEITARKTADPDRRDAVVKVEETTTGQLLLGVAVTSDSGLSGQIVFRQRNFDYARPPSSWRDVAEGRAWVGGGQTFEVDARPGTEFTRFAVNYKDPHVDDSTYSLGFSAQRWEREWDTYAEKRISGSVSVGREFGRDAFWEVAATGGTVEVSGIELFDRNKDGSVTPADTPDYLAKVDGNNQVNLLGFTVGHDTRNEFFMPTEGHLVSARVEASGDALASDFDFLRFILKGRWYVELSRDELDRPHVLSWRGKLGVMVPKDGGDDSPIFERFFVGGSTDVRGFAYRGLGPHDFDEPTGGEFMALGGIQYEYPLAGDRFRGVVFWDAGTLVDGPGDLRADLVRNSLGFGFRFFIPPPLNLPVAADFGFAVGEEDEDDTQVFSLGLGRAI